MKIVFVLPDMPGGGTERVVSLLAEEFVGRGFQVSIVLFAGSQVAYPLDERIEVVCLGEKSDGNPFVRAKRLLSMRRFYKQNAGCTIFAFSAMGAVFSVIAATGISHKLLVSERNDPSQYEHRRIRDWAYKKADRLVLQTEDVRKCFPDTWKDKIAVIPNPVPEKLPEPYQGERIKRVVSVARLEPQKNHILLITAFAEFLKTYPDYELHIFGVGELEHMLREQVSKLGLDDKITFRGFSKNVREEILDSKMYVLSSDYEGISNSMIEALALGIPVISTNCPIGGSKAYIRDGENGILVPVGDKRALCQAMKNLAGDDSLADRLSKNAIKVRDTYALANIADNFLQEIGILNGDLLS